MKVSNYARRFGLTDQQAKTVVLRSVTKREARSDIRSVSFITRDNGVIKAVSLRNDTYPQLYRTVVVEFSPLGFVKSSHCEDEWGLITPIHLSSATCGKINLPSWGAFSYARCATRGDFHESTEFMWLARGKLTRNGKFLESTGLSSNS